MRLIITPYLIEISGLQFDGDITEYEEELAPLVEHVGAEALIERFRDRVTLNQHVLAARPDYQCDAIIFHFLFKAFATEVLSDGVLNMFKAMGEQCQRIAEGD